MDEVSAIADGMFENISRLLGKSDELQRLADEKQRRSQLDEGRSTVPPAEGKQESVQRQERLRKRDKGRGQEIEL